MRRPWLFLAAIAMVLMIAGCSSPPEQLPTVDPEPAPASGSADDQALPAATALGDGWTVDSSPEGGEHAETGAEGWLTQRDPAELMWGLAPLGCPDAVGATGYPLPEHAVQGRYLQPDGQYAVALRLSFAQDDSAAVLLTAMGSDAATCTAKPAADDPSYHRRYAIAESSPDGLRLSFTESGPGATDSMWHIQAKRTGATVVMLYVEQGPDGAGSVPDLDAVLPDVG